MSKEGIKLSDITPKKAFMFLRSKWRKLRGGIRIREEDAIAFAEVIMYRSLSCPQCVIDGKCSKTGLEKGCGCDVPQLMVAMESECGKGTAIEEPSPRWHELPAKGWADEWRRYKEEKKVIFYKLYT